MSPPNPHGQAAFLEGNSQAVASGADGARRQQRLGRVRGIREWAIVMSVAVGVALIVRAFLVQSFFIPSGSMIPTLKIHDRVLVNKLSYRLHDVHRGDVVVFERPANTGSSDDIKDLIKRVVALPGDTIDFKDNRVLINGRLLDEPYIDPSIPSVKKTWPMPFTVPVNMVFVMGDNREDSRDSRYFGPIDEKLIVGRAVTTFWPPKSLKWL